MSLTIKTNLASLIAQSSLTNSTNKLNQAIERMTTGYKINHASDNAANYSIATNMTTKINAYQVAEDNVSMGLDLVQTASSTLESMGDLTTRLRALATQAQNGTYGNQSINALTKEANSIAAEINRIKTTAEYNGIKLFSADKSKFIKDVTVRDTSSMTKLLEVDGNTELTSGTYSISTADELVKLAKMTNNGKIGADTEFVLANDIDLSEYSSGEGWVPIGKYIKGDASVSFRGKFDGNGYTISNLYVNRPNSGYQGLFGAINNANIQNLEVKNANISGAMGCGALVGAAVSSSIKNCCVSGSVKSTGKYVGGLAGILQGSTLLDSYALCSVNGSGFVGGIAGTVQSKSSIEGCYAEVEVEGGEGQQQIGGLVGRLNASSITNSFAIGNVKGFKFVGGLAGVVNSSTVDNCYANCNVEGTDCIIGGLAGSAEKLSTISNSYATGNVELSSTGKYSAGGLVGQLGGSDTSSTILNCYTTGTVKGPSQVGGLVGFSWNNSSIENSFTTSNVEGNKMVGGLIGALQDTEIHNCYSNGHVTGKTYIGGLVGFLEKSNNSISGSYATGYVSGSKNAGGMIGAVNADATVTITDIYYDKEKTCQNVGVNYLKTNVGDSTGGVTTKELNNLIQQGTLPLYNNNKTGGSLVNKALTLQVGVSASDSSQIGLTLQSVDLSSLNNLDLQSDTIFETLDDILAKINDQQTSLGSTQNRLMSALDEISTQYENLVSSRSTLRDADIADVSSEYIKMQILQNTSATLLATANQSPALALQLL